MTTSSERAPSPIDRFAAIGRRVRAGEGATVLLMAFNVFVVMLAYYVIKTVREPLILVSGGDGDVFSGPEGKAYAAAAQALVLIPATALYARLTRSWPVMTLIKRVMFFFAGCLVAFWAGAQFALPYLGFAFYVWVGVFNVAAVAQFWAFANDVYNKESGERLFPLIMVGMALGGFAGGTIAGWLFDLGLSAFTMMPITAALLLLHLAMYGVVIRRPDVEFSNEVKTDDTPDAMSDKGAFQLIFESPYLMRIALMLVLANMVNTTGEYVLSAMVTESAGTGPEAEAFIGAFFGSYYGTVSLAVLAIQTLLVSRIVKYGGIRAVVLALPLIALGAYGLIAMGAGLAAVRWAKTAENSTDYSVMGTAKAMLWLPTTREEKYKAKLAIDTVFVRFGDMFSAGLVYLGMNQLDFSLSTFAVVNIAVIGVWVAIAWSLAKRYKQLAAELPEEPETF